MPQSQSILRLLLKHGLPAALALSAAASLTWLSGNTVVLELFNNWFNTTHNYGATEPQPPDSPEVPAQEPSNQIYLKPITVSPNINIDPALIWEAPITITPNLEVTPKVEVNPQITFPNVEIAPNIEANPQITFPEVEVNPTADIAPALNFPVEFEISPQSGAPLPEWPEADPQPSGRFSPGESPQIPISQLSLPPKPASNPFFEQIEPVLEPLSAQTLPSPGKSSGQAKSGDNPVAKELPSFQFAPQALPPELMTGQGMVKQSERITGNASLASTLMNFETARNNYQRVPEPGMALGILSVGIGLVGMRLRTRQTMAQLNG